MSPKAIEAGPLEMEVLGMIEERGEVSVTDIQSALKKSGKDLAYTTVMTVELKELRRRVDERLKVANKPGTRSG